MFYRFHITGRRNSENPFTLANFFWQGNGRRRVSSRIRQQNSGPGEIAIKFLGLE